MGGGGELLSITLMSIELKMVTNIHVETSKTNTLALLFNTVTFNTLATVDKGDIFIAEYYNVIPDHIYHWIVF
jgi:hypothetical protein